MIAMMIFLVFLVGGILAIGRFRNDLLGTSRTADDLEANPAWLEQAIAQYRAANAASAGSARD